MDGVSIVCLLRLAEVVEDSGFNCQRKLFQRVVIECNDRKRPNLGPVERGYLVAQTQKCALTIRLDPWSQIEVRRAIYGLVNIEKIVKSRTNLIVKNCLL